jgi:hypothetical protein
MTSWLKHSLIVPVLLCLMSGTASGIGTCREAGCGDGSSKPPPPKCDEAALAQAQQEFNRLMQEYKEKRTEADADWNTSSALYQEASTKFEEEMGLSELSTNGVELSLHEILDEIITHHGGKELAEEFGSFGSTVSLGLLCYKMGALIRDMERIGKEADAAAAEAEEASDQAYQALKSARAAHDRLEALKKQCQAASGAGGGSARGRSGDQDPWKSNAQKEAEAAQQILSGWKRVAGGYEDMNGDFHDTDTALQEALQIVQGGGSSSGPRPRMFFVSQAIGSTGGDASLSAEVRRKFISKLARVFTRFEKGAKRFLTIGEQLDKIHQAQARLVLRH